jgi:hypothetical protein
MTWPGTEVQTLPGGYPTSDTMTPHESAEHRQVHEADPDAVEVRQPDVDDGSANLFRIRMPITSTGEARDGEAFSDDRLRAFQAQLQSERVPLFLDHGRGGPGETRYGQLRKVGYWDAPSIEERGGTTDLDADAVLVDPDTLDDDVGEVREALSWLRAQAEAGLPISASVGWSEDVGDRDVPGDADLLEVSIVGIPSDPRTTTTTSDAEVAMARAVSSATDEFDVEAFVRTLADLSERPFGPPEGDGDEFEDFDDCVKTLLDENDDMDREDAEALCATWEQDDSETDPDDEATELTNDMTDDDSPPDDESGDDRDESDGIDPAEFRESMLEMQRTQTETLETLSDAIREGDKDDDEDEDEDDEDDDMDENAADADDAGRGGDDPDGGRTVTLDGEELAVDEASERIADLRDELAALDSDDVEEPQTQDRVDDTEDSDAGGSGFGFTEAHE